MKLLEQTRLDSKTLAWVGGAHILVLLIAFLVPSLMRPKPQEQYITLIPLGTENPGEGRPDSPDNSSGGSPTASGIKAFTPPAPQPPAPSRIETPLEPAARVKPVEAVKPVADEIPLKPVLKKAEPSIKTLKPTPSLATESTPKEIPKPKVKVDLTKVVNKSTAPKAGNNPQSSPSTGTASSSSGLTTSDVEKKLPGKFGSGTGIGSGNSSGERGIKSGQGEGSPGSPNGVENAPWYDTYIGIQLKKNWAQPVAEGALVTSVSVRILADGTVQFMRITKPSGNTAMDQSVVNAVQSVRKLGNPPPPGLPNPYDRVVKFEL